MSYALAAALQTAVYGMLSAAPGLAGVAIHDALPLGGGSGTFVFIGPEEVLDRSDGSGAGAEHRMSLSVISDAVGFLAAKNVAAEIALALGGALPALTVGRVVSIRFSKAVARRMQQGEMRRIDLIYHIRVEV